MASDARDEPEDSTTSTTARALCGAYLLGYSHVNQAGMVDSLATSSAPPTRPTICENLSTCAPSSDGFHAQLHLALTPGEGLLVTRCRRRPWARSTTLAQNGLSTARGGGGKEWNGMDEWIYRNGMEWNGMEWNGRTR